MAYERPLPRVNVPVLQHALLLGERISAVGALVRPLPRVRAHVVPQVELVTEESPTVGAAEDLAVDAPVLCQLSVGGEGHLALLAGKWHRPTLVSAQVPQPGEILSTVRTCMTPSRCSFFCIMFRGHFRHSGGGFLDYVSSSGSQWWLACVRRW